uniref:[histone H3]-trimethyl-L-lysine(4) demethylase n=1 Tax=Iconisemion striatum TaxID=60296 RepID=A0A1A7XIH8_9TELE
MSQPRQDEFKPPPECPVFEPSWEEFRDPYAFINKIRPIAEKTGICKVRPPPDWQPPFACDVDKLHFVPRIQRLNELEAQTRVKLNFLDQIAKFWDLQGCTLKIPHVERKILDLYKLNKLVADEGGFDLVCQDRRWTRIAIQMGFTPGKAIGSHLRGHYERILYPYNLFQSGTNLLAPDPASKLVGLEADPDPEQCVQNPFQLTENEDNKDHKQLDQVLKQPDQSHQQPNQTHQQLDQVLDQPDQTQKQLDQVLDQPDQTQKQLDQVLDQPDQTQQQLDQVLKQPTPSPDPSPGARRAKRMKCEATCVKIEPGEASENKPNLRRRMGSFVAKLEPEKQIPVPVKQEPVEFKQPVDVDKFKSRYKKMISLVPPSPVDLVVCLVCGSGEDEDRLLLCDGCDDSYHTFCLIPSLQDVPKGDWRCPKCLAQECCKPHEAFGFEQAHRDYSLRAFGQMADAFKSDYFNMPVHMVPMELVEKEFWRLVGAIEEDVTVEYGADIASKEFGSGFPIPNGKYKVSPADEKYLNCGWNLNNLAMMNPSVLTHVTADICGMTLPWLYVGMCFSSFCWHIEDHWSYSINYLHWGEPKTWYGAPGFAAEQLEEVMKKLAPELFESQPDLLHQLVTIMNPNTLMAHGVPIYRTNQCAGEFVITFPRAYHSGFNQGFNFAEAVNFCTVDWMPLGRQCVDHYRLLHRYNVFSHDEMVCNMARKAGTLNVVLASAVHKDMRLMIKEEQELRDKVKKMGVLQCTEATYDHLQDDERQCAKCRTTCYLSAITCPCSPGVLVCLYHIRDLCSCSVSNYLMNYRYTMDDLFPMMNAVKQRAEMYDEWASRVTETLEAKLEKKKGLPVFRSLLSESESKLFPDNDLLRRLRLVTQDAEKCASVAQQLLNGKKQTRYRCGSGKSRSQLTVEELSSFVRQLYNLCCSLPQAPMLKELLNRIEDFQQHSEKVLAEEAPSFSEIQSLLDISFDFDVDLPELPPLRERLEQARWLEGVQQASAQPATLTLETMRRLIDQGVGLAPHPAVEKAMARLQEQLTLSEQWEEKASSLLKARPPHSIETLNAAAEKASGIPAYLPNCLLLKDTIRRAHEWLQEAEELQASGCMLMVDCLSDMVLRGQAIQVQLEPLDGLESLMADVQQWKKSAAATFLQKDSTLTLLEVLCPRFEVGNVDSPKRKVKKGKESPKGTKKKSARVNSVSDVHKTLSETTDSTSATSTLEELRVREMETFSNLRAANESKLLPTADCMDLKVCFCQKAPMGAMLQCELCRDAFHSVCVRDPSDSCEAQPWLCPHCRRSEKPQLSRVLSVLASLQSIGVRLPEGDALNYLVERTLNWQLRVQQILQACDLPDLEERPGTPPTLTHWVSGCDNVHNNSQAPCLTPEWNRSSHAQTVFYTEQRCIPLQGLSSELEELMVEGLLLQVSLPQVQSLYHVLLDRASSQHTNRPTSPTQEEATECDQHMQFISQGTNIPLNQDDTSSTRETMTTSERKAKRRLERADLDTEHRGKDKKHSHKRQRMNKKKMQRRPTSTSSSPRSDFSQSDDSDKEMAMCPAESCQLPEGDEVDWVQCDGSCNQWFHQVCVGVTPEMAEKEDYICVSCSLKDGHMRK